MAAPIPVKG
jgi:uncharacterized circularly permuted ATP-grasp superfamily protein